MGRGTRAGEIAIPKITLRPAGPTDAQHLARWRREPSIRRFQPLPELDVESLEADLRRQDHRDLRRRRGEKFQWLVEVDGDAVGWVTLAVINWEHGLGEIGYAMTTAWQGRGIMRRALRMLLQDLFATTKLERIEARCASANDASRHVLEAVGFRHEGTLQGYFVLDGERIDNELYAVLKREWEGE